MGDHVADCRDESGPDRGDGISRCPDCGRLAFQCDCPTYDPYVDDRPEQRRQKVAVCVCTYKRPKMLADCLRSLAALHIPAGIDARFVVIDNDAAHSGHGVIAELGTTRPWHLYYLPEPRRGIASARNAALALSMKIGADWLVFIDDDETAAPDWLQRLFEAQRCFDADVVHGHVDFIYPEPLPRWAFPKKPKPYWSVSAKTAFTHNVLFRAELVSNGLRFDESYGLSGGEDNHFFSRARKAGALIVHTPRAIVFETLPASKLTFRKQVMRNFWIANSQVWTESDVRGRSQTVRRKSTKAIGRFFSGLMELVRLPLSAAHGAANGRRRLMKAASCFAEVAGVLSAFAGYRPKPYANVDGA